MEMSKPAPQVGTRFRPFDANNKDVQVGAPFGRSHVGSTMNTGSNRSFQTRRAHRLRPIIVPENSVQNPPSESIFAGHGCRTKAKPPRRSNLSKTGQRLLPRRPTYRDYACMPLSKKESHRNAKNDLSVAMKQKNKGAANNTKCRIPKKNIANLRKEGCRVQKAVNSSAKNGPAPEKSTPFCENSSPERDVPGIQPTPSCISTNHHSQDTKKRVDVSESPIFSSTQANNVRFALKDVRGERRPEDVIDRHLVNNAHTAMGEAAGVRPGQYITPRRSRLGATTTAPDLPPQRRESLNQTSSKCHVPRPPEKRPVDVPKKRRPLVHCRSRVNLPSEATVKKTQRQEKTSDERANFPLSRKGKNPIHPDNGLDGEYTNITQLVLDPLSLSPCVAEQTSPKDEGIGCSNRNKPVFRPSQIQKEMIKSPDHGGLCQMESTGPLCANNDLSSVVPPETAIPNQECPMDECLVDVSKCATIAEEEPIGKPSVLCEALQLEAEFSPPAVLTSIDSKDIRRSSLLPAGKDIENTRSIWMDSKRPRTRRTLARSLSVPARPAFPEEGSVIPNIYDHEDYILELFRRTAASAHRNAICGELERSHQPVKINGRRMSTHDMRKEMSETAKITANKKGRFRRMRWSPHLEEYHRTSSNDFKNTVEHSR